MTMTLNDVESAAATDNIDASDHAEEGADSVFSATSLETEFDSKVDAILSKLDQIEETMTASVLAKLAQELEIAVACKSRLEKITDKITTIESAVNVQGTTLATFCDHVLAVQRFTDGINDRIDLVETQLKGLKTASNSLEVRTFEMNLTLGKQEARIKEINRVSNGIDHKMDEMHTILAKEIAASAYIERLDESMKIVEKKIDSMMTASNGQQSKIDRSIKTSDEGLTRMAEQVEDIREIACSIETKTDNVLSMVEELSPDIDDLSNTLGHIEYQNFKIEEQTGGNSSTAVQKFCEDLEQEIVAGSQQLERKLERLMAAVGCASEPPSSPIPQFMGSSTAGSLKIVETSSKTIFLGNEMEVESPSGSNTLAMPAANATLYMYDDDVVLGDSLAATLLNKVKNSSTVRTTSGKQDIENELRKLPNTKKVLLIFGFDEHLKSSFDANVFISNYRELIEWLANRNHDNVFVANVPPIAAKIQNLRYWKCLSRLNTCIHSESLKAGVNLVNFDRVFLKINTEKQCHADYFYLDRAGKPRFKVRYQQYQNGVPVAEGRQSQQFSIRALGSMMEKFNAVVRAVDEAKGRDQRRNRSTSSSPPERVTIGGLWRVAKDGSLINDHARYLLMEVHGLNFPGMIVTGSPLNLIIVELYERIRALSNVVFREVETENVEMYDYAGGRIGDIIKTVVLPTQFHKTNGQRILIPMKFRVVPSLNIPVMIGMEMVDLCSRFLISANYWDIAIKDQRRKEHQLRVFSPTEIGRVMEPEELEFLQMHSRCRISAP